MPPVLRLMAAHGVLALSACRTPQPASAPPAPPAAASSSSVAQAGPRPPADSEISTGPDAVSIRRGLALLLHTRDSLPRNVGNTLACGNCHLDAGRRQNGTWVGVHARYPQYRARSHQVETIEYRVNDCFKRSMNGKPLDYASDEMRDIVAYFAFLSRGVPVGPAARPPAGPWGQMTRDTTRGAAVYRAKCAVCHGPGGEGTAAGPPVWGNQSYNIGAGMARVFTAAGFIKHNMPFNEPGTLSDQESLDVAAYVNAHPRPDFAGKENDWPAGGAPADVAYPVSSMKKASAQR